MQFVNGPRRGLSAGYPWLVLGCVVLILGGAASSFAARDPGAGSRAPLASLRISTGSDSSVDTYLEVTADEFGSFGEYIDSALDGYNPVGSLDMASPTFMTWFILFANDVSQKVTLSTVPLDDDGSMTATITMMNVASDTDTDGVDDTLTSAFTVEGTGTSLMFDLVQHVRNPNTETAQLVQMYTITNMAADPIAFDLVRSYDGDLLWAGDFSDDEVGTSANSAGMGTFVVEQDSLEPTVTAVTLSGPSANAYYGGKHGVQPAGGPPPYDYGTDNEVWEANGIPASWVNHIAGVGYDTDGWSGAMPPGSTDPYDAFTGIGYHVELEPSQSTMICVYITYGSDVPVDAMQCGDQGGGNEGKVTLCHIPPGNPDNAHTINVGASAVDAHLAHGDYMGPCQ
jgi:hypothetical protein